MASSLQTLIKILRLEQQKGHQNKAVIGGFGRFAHHWAREAHGQAKTDSHHALVDEIARLLREYEMQGEDERPAMVEEIIALATGQARMVEEAGDLAAPAREPPPASSEGARDEGARDEGAEGDEFDFLLEEEEGEREAEERVEGVPVRGVRERRGYAWRQPQPVSEADLRGLDESPTTVSGVGDKRLEQLERLGVHTVGDMLLLFPRRYDDYSRMKTIRQLEVGEEVTVIGTLERIKAVRMKSGKVRVEAYLGDGSGHLRLNWFNQPWMEQQLNEGEPVVVSGKVDQYLGRLVINSPELEAVERDWLHTGRVVPVYPLTKGLSGRMMRNLMKTVVDTWTPLLPDYLPIEIRENIDLMDYGDAIAQAHFPDSSEDQEAALYRLAFDELFTLHVGMLRWRHTWQAREGTPLAVDDEWASAFESTLPYELTGAQRQAIADIRHDMASGIPMNRLLQGDVGSGKTAVAALAMGIAVANGVQAALMAPTSVLAEQHYANLTGILGNALGEEVTVVLLTGYTGQREREMIYAGLADGSIQVVVGTHALIQEGVAFEHLGLAVIDEQHRFGVAQRGALREKAAGGNPHLLVTTATPIPRTLALTVHADLDLTVIDEMPEGREPVETRVLQPKERERAYSFIRGQVEQGHQAFIIYPLIEESENLDARAVVPDYERLQGEIFPDLRVGLLHGRMNADEKEAVMADFYHGRSDILASTTVIEVGIDVPNATVMMVEDANRFGLAQLHQLRGRVGRGGAKGYCLLVSDRAFIDGDDRLSAMEETSDGFRLAQIDWEMRGAGDLLGTRQSGLGMIRFANLMDARLVDQVQREARALLERDPELALPEHELLAQRTEGLSRGGDVS
jgi:ATP-dependent DNA helicase RecG